MSISRIEEVAVNRLAIDLDYAYEFSSGRSLSSIDSSIVEITTADCLTGGGRRAPVVTTICQIIPPAIVPYSAVIGDPVVEFGR